MCVSTYVGIYDTYVHSYLIWNWVITRPMRAGERSFEWTQRPAMVIIDLFINT